MANSSSSKRALANKKRQLNVQRASRLGRKLTMNLATLLSFVTVTLLVVDRLYRPNHFKIDQLKIQGQFRYLQPIEIEDLIQTNDLGNFFAVDLAAIKADVESHAWVQQADIRREWPDTLNVLIKEHRPVARWKKNQWVNSQGEVVDLPFESIKAKNQMSRMAKVSIELDGKPQDAPMMLTQAIAWKRQLQSSGLAIRRLELSASHAWTMRLHHSSNKAEFTLLLGREEVAQRLARFQKLFEKHFRQSNEQLQRVDARYPDGLAIKSKPLKLKPGLAQVNSSTVNDHVSTLSLINPPLVDTPLASRSPVLIGKRYE